MDNIQERNISTNLPSSQTCRSYPRSLVLLLFLLLLLLCFIAALFLIQIYLCFKLCSSITKTVNFTTLCIADFCIQHSLFKLNYSENSHISAANVVGTFVY
jgi:hypothetical protein